MLNNIGLLLSYSDPAASQAAYEERLTLHRATGNRLGEAYVLSNLGLNAANQMKYEESRQR